MRGGRIAANACRRIALHAYDRLGGNGLAGLVLIAAATACWILAGRLHLEADQLHVRAGASAAQDVRLAARGAAADGEPVHVDESLPLLSTSTADLRTIFRIAGNDQLELHEGQYTLARIEGAPDLVRLDVNLPVKNRYAAIKRFVANVLNGMPHASLAELRAERPDSATDELDATVHFALYYRGRTT